MRIENQMDLAITLSLRETYMWITLTCVFNIANLKYLDHCPNSTLYNPEIVEQGLIQTSIFPNNF